MILRRFFILCAAGLFLAACTAAPSADVAWPAVTQTSKPWTRWWWHGSSVTPAGITAALEAYRDAGLGGVEITPIYGVAGYEDAFVPYLSDEWVDLLIHTLREADRLGLGVDMATGTGWPFGGPHVDDASASRYATHATYRLREGQRLATPVVARQTPILRAVGNQIYELTSGIYGPTGQPAVDESRQRSPSDHLTISDLAEPVTANENLQALALDQVRYDRPMPLAALVAYSDAGDRIDLTGSVDAAGRLDWTAPAGEWTLYAVFQGWHGKMVERAAPGGEGMVIDHFSESAIDRYLAPFDEAFAGRDLGSLRAFFNDSYEVDDASGQADWTPDFFDAFREHRGYDLRDHLPALFGEGDEDEAIRVLTDYRETFSDLLLERFTARWSGWAHGHGAIVRNQAHGSPANILDLYAASDIPETEGTDILRAKMASSAANVSGKPLSSSESATWLNEHFLSSLGDVRKALELFWLAGVNHVLYHGTAYSPAEAAWPGWLFYAAVHMTPVNPLWTDFPALNAYASRVQSFLQMGTPDNDVLLYYPFHDRIARRGREMLAHFDGGLGVGFEGMPFKEAAEWMQAEGVAFDFVSDRLLERVSVADHVLLAGNARYQTLVVPAVQFMPPATLEHIALLVESGATVVVAGALPADVPGWGELEGRRAERARILAQFDFTPTPAAGVSEAALGAGRLVLADRLEDGLTYAGIRRETLPEHGLAFVRRKQASGTTYFVVNTGTAAVDGWVPFGVADRYAALFDPLLATLGVADTREAADGGLEVYLQIPPGSSRIVQTSAGAPRGAGYPYYQRDDVMVALGSAWQVAFTAGGPERPEPVRVDALTLSSWTEWDMPALERFSGTAVYSQTFPRPSRQADAWLLDLGDVRVAARVRLNGEELAVLIGPEWQVMIPPGKLKDENLLEVEVTNLMANRIADMDRRGEVWKTFYNVNIAARLRENRNERGLFDASAWAPLRSGLLGPVTLVPLTNGHQ
ncbi:MAG: glycosyl hydrolase [Rhodothermales bacterium]